MQMDPTFANQAKIQQAQNRRRFLQDLPSGAGSESAVFSNFYDGEIVVGLKR